MTWAARKLRANPTDAEKRLWSRLKGNQLGFHFTRQYPIECYVADFVCRSAKLVIEVDGGQHAASDNDAMRTRVIELYGYRLIRFWNIDVLANTDGVVQAIAEELASASNRKGWRGGLERDEFPDIPGRG